MTDYQPRYKWRRTQIDENDPPTDLDWIGTDGAFADRPHPKRASRPDEKQVALGRMVSKDAHGTPAHTKRRLR